MAPDSCRVAPPRHCLGDVSGQGAVQLAVPIQIAADPRVLQLKEIRVILNPLLIGVLSLLGDASS